MTYSKRPIKILYSETYTHIAGGQKGLLDIVKHIDKNKFTPIVQVQGPGKLFDALKNLGISCVVKRLEPFKNRWLPYSWLLGIKPFIKVIRSVNPDIIHSNHLYAGRYSGRAAQKMGIPSLVTLRLVHYPEVFDKYNRINTLKIHNSIVSNSNTGREILSDIPEIQHKLITIHNGMDLEKFQPHSNPAHLKSELAKEYGWSPNATIIMQVSSRVPQKGNEDLTRAFLNLCKKNHKDIYLVFVGGPFNKADNKSTLISMADACGFKSRIIFTDFLWDVSDFLKLADISVLASRQREGLPRSLIEAMACGNPLIGTDVGGVKELIQHEKNGFLIKASAPLELEHRLEQLIINADLRRSMGDFGHKLAVEKFDIKNMISKYEAQYIKLAGI